MTSPTPFSDEELSDAIDGDLDPSRAAELDADPAARARRDAMAAAATAVGAPVAPLDATTVDALIAEAIDAPLAPAAPRRTTRGPNPLLVAAVVIVLVAVGLGLVWSGRNGATDERASFDTVGSSINAEASDAEAGDASGAGTDGAEASSVVPDMESSTATTIAPSGSAAVALGEFASGDELRAALADSFPSADTEVGAGSESAPGEAAPSAAAVERCAEQLEITLDLDGPPTRTGYATVDGRAVLVYEFDAASFDDGTPTTLVAAVGQDACDQVVIFQR